MVHFVHPFSLNSRLDVFRARKFQTVQESGMRLAWILVEQFSTPVAVGCSQLASGISTVSSSSLQRIEVGKCTSEFLVMHRIGILILARQASRWQVHARPIDLSALPLKDESRRVSDQ